MPPRPRRPREPLPLGEEPPTMPPGLPHAQRAVQVEEPDPVAERNDQLSAAYADYNEVVEALWETYLAEARGAWEKYQRRLQAATADYQAAVERIRST